MNTIEIIAKLDALYSGDTECDHIEADDLLLTFLKDHDPASREVAEAFERARKRCGFWYA